MRINLITPRSGGPLNCGRDLARFVNRQAGFSAKHIHDTAGLLFSPFFQNCDLVHAAVPITLRLWRKPFVLTIHGDYTRERNIWRRFYPLAVRLASVTTVPSRFLKNVLGLEKAVVLPNAVDLEKFPQAPLSDGDEIKILTVTQFWFPDKAAGVIEIARALDGLPEKIRKRLRYTVLGAGPYLEEVREKTGNVTFRTELAGLQDPRPYLAEADLFAYHSTFDNMPISVLEAMASGLPVVANGVGAISEMITDGKDGFIRNDTASYTATLAFLIADIGRRRAIGNAARRTVEQRFNWEKVILDYLRLYQSLL